MLVVNSLCKNIFLTFLANSLCFSCLEKWTFKFLVFPVPRQPCYCNATVSLYCQRSSANDMPATPFFLEIFEKIKVLRDCNCSSYTVYVGPHLGKPMSMGKPDFHTVTHEPPLVSSCVYASLEGKQSTFVKQRAKKFLSQIYI